VIEAQIQSKDAPEYADAPLDPSPKAEALPENHLCFSWRFRFAESLPLLGKTARFTPASWANLSFSAE
jgi:hypothetical protein